MIHLISENKNGNNGRRQNHKNIRRKATIGKIGICKIHKTLLTTESVLTDKQHREKR